MHFLFLLMHLKVKKYILIRYWNHGQSNNGPSLFSIPTFSERHQPTHDHDDFLKHNVCFKKGYGFTNFVFLLLFWNMCSHDRRGESSAREHVTEIWCFLSLCSFPRNLYACSLANPLIKEGNPDRSFKEFRITPYADATELLIHLKK